MKFRISPLRSLSLVTLSSAALLAACSQAPAEEEAATTSDSAFTTSDFRNSCALGDDSAHGAVWVNYRAEAIGCGQVNPVGDGASGAYGAVVRGRILCAINWLRNNQSDKFGLLGSVVDQGANNDGVSGERHFVDGTRDGEAWVTDFTSGSRVQFQWNGPCGEDGNGYLKLYYKGGQPGGLPPLPNELRGCGFQQTADIPPGDTNGHITFSSDNCGVVVDQWYTGNLADHMSMTLRYGITEVRVATVRQFRNGQAHYVPQSWDAVVGDAATTYSYALGALQNASWIVPANGGNGDACLGSVAGLGAGMLGMLRTCAAGPAACAVDVLWTLSGAFNTAASC